MGRLLNKSKSYSVQLPDDSSYLGHACTDNVGAFAHFVHSVVCADYACLGLGYLVYNSV